ncbi:MAG TPA: hypothetical protein DCP68_04080, partial [Ruminococcus sp.]|nr:hypothetical protein [Ruminococcus sp.]
MQTGKPKPVRYKKKNRTTAAVGALLTALTAAVTPAAVPLTASADAPFAELYVSPDGSDGNAGTIDAPLQTLAGARDAVRGLSGSMNGDIIVYLRGGVYRQT